MLNITWKFHERFQIEHRRLCGSAFSWIVFTLIEPGIRNEKWNEELKWIIMINKCIFVIRCVWRRWSMIDCNTWGIWQRFEYRKYEIADHYICGMVKTLIQHLSVISNHRNKSNCKYDGLSVCNNIFFFHSLFMPNRIFRTQRTKWRFECVVDID